MNDNDLKFMKVAMKLSKKGINYVDDNPMVGCVIVKNNKIISKGYHKKSGSNHAEIEAIINLKSVVTDDMIMYVTLEPCTHFGKTPPCADAIIKSGIRNVVIATLDPNPINTGNGVKKLNDFNIKTKIGILENEIKSLNNIFFFSQRSEYPYIFSKIAMSIDGKTATHCGNSKWITSPLAREFVKKERDKYMAIMVGTNTIIKDDPTLFGKYKNPIRIIIDRELKISIESNVYQTADVAKNILVTSVKMYNSFILNNLSPLVSQIIFVNENNNKLNIEEALVKLKKIGIVSIYVEGGAELHWSLLEKNLCNRIQFIIAPLIIGGKQAKCTVGGKGVDSLLDSFQLSNIKIRRLNNEIIYEGDL
ncbi:bifunctional diaminohydroxyphosphoribosylaminopyrimidine deaminase/5-amino-6-(5-phosphoribosylamino)uracil reductase RibD [Spiroplasma endosymbiont of Aspidapion aeneum]|uniref:bifunctional diaminohydroxyphosphoribosylaminopyrimidine deaminase/5-amino-6-(5-phosphoribosylamino)uracil reductase RibD n=1 Tax=Spiroplasma endosymbiont of Aspidapion aeneum TaxID=3066276 RepID=UPI00313DCA9B